jgi:hypothetical protein
MPEKVGTLKRFDSPKMALAGFIGAFAALLVGYFTPLSGFLVKKYVEVNTDTVLEQIRTRDYAGTAQGGGKKFHRRLSR